MVKVRDIEDQLALIRHNPELEEIVNMPFREIVCMPQAGREENEKELGDCRSYT